VLEAGLRTFPVSLGAFLTAPLAGQLVSRIGSRLPIVVGAFLCACTVCLLAFLEPATGYASLWWILALLGIGFGLSLSPLTATVFSVTPPERAGLGSSMFNTSNRLGNTLGVAALGTFVVQQFASNIPVQLTQRGVPSPLASAIANRIAAAGGQASHLPLAGHLPLSLAVLYQAITQAFVDALHGAFLIAGLTALALALLALFLLQPKQRQAQQAAPGTLPVGEPARGAQLVAAEAPEK